MARTRKLFPSYGSSLAMHLLAALERERIVDTFVGSYVSTYKRNGILGGPARARELSETVGREIVLMAVHEVRQSLPRYMGKKPGAALNPDEEKIVEALFAELHSTLGRIWRWTAEDRSQFQRDLNLYSDSASPKNIPKSRTNKKNRVHVESPFVGHVALLLDPSMIDQARRATEKFQGDVRKFAQRVLRETLNPRGS